MTNIKPIPVLELNSFGGFYAGSQHNYPLFGQGDPNHSDSVSLTAAISTNEVAELVCRVLDITPTGKTSPYADAANSYGIEMYYTSPQIFTGSVNPNGGKPLFNGGKDLTRAQVCTIIVRVMNLVNT